MSNACYGRHAVHVLAGCSEPIGFQIEPTGDLALYLEHYDSEEDVSYVRVYGFERVDDLRDWLANSRITVVSSFLDDLGRHVRGEMDLRSEQSRQWTASLADVLALPERAYVVTWSLSHESPDSSNSDTTSTLADAMELLVDTGALQSIPGNSGAISMGSVVLNATWFTCDGIDRGDSPIDPAMAVSEAMLFGQILQHEAQRAVPA